MLSIRKENFFTAKLKGLVYKIFSMLENNNNADFDSNGENNFLKAYLKNFVKKEAVFFDVGANVGKYSEMLLKYAVQYGIDYKIHVFEPVGASMAVLRKKFGNNSNIILNQFGLSDKEGTAEIYYDKEGSSLASLYQRDLTQSNIRLSLKEQIKLRPLENYLNEHQIAKIDFLKIDVEGHEMPAFKGMGKYLHSEVISAIQFEYGGANIDSGTFLKNLYTLLESRKYQVCKIKKTYLEPRPYDVRMENFAYANFVALKKIG